MVSFEEAIRLVEQECLLGGIETIATPDAYARVLAEDVFSLLALPGADNSAMDGYAAQSVMTSQASADNPVQLRVLEQEAAAGENQHVLEQPDTALPIMTGGFIPEGADTVIQLEHVHRERDILHLKKGVSAGIHIRKKGEDIAQGALVQTAGTRLNAGMIGQLVAVGKADVAVGKRPRVAILATGNELLAYDEPNQDGRKVYSCNSYFLAAKVRQAGGAVQLLGIAGDNQDDLLQKLQVGLEQADILITTGGVSVGKYDLVKESLLQLGVNEIFHKAKIKPGKPIFFGTHPDTLVFGLPGNPAAAAATFDLFAERTICRFQGASTPRKQMTTAFLQEPLKKKTGRRQFLRGTYSLVAGKVLVKSSGGQGSGMVGSLAAANCLIELDDAVSIVAAGELVTIHYWPGS